MDLLARPLWQCRRRRCRHQMRKLLLCFFFFFFFFVKHHYSVNSFFQGYHILDDFAPTFLLCKESIFWKIYRELRCLEMFLTYSFNDSMDSQSLWWYESISLKDILIFLMNVLNFFVNWIFFFCFSCVFTNCSIRSIVVSKYFFNPLCFIF